MKKNEYDSINEGKKSKIKLYVTASCNYWRWGSAGVQENINAICILALNHINDKVFLSSLVVVVVVIVVVVVRVAVVLDVAAVRVISNIPIFVVSSMMDFNQQQMPLLKVFLILWWWFLFITLVAFIRIFYRALQCK